MKHITLRYFSLLIWSSNLCLTVSSFPDPNSGSSQCISLSFYYSVYSKMTRTVCGLWVLLFQGRQMCAYAVNTIYFAEFMIYVMFKLDKFSTKFGYTNVPITNITFFATHIGYFYSDVFIQTCALYSHCFLLERPIPYGTKLRHNLC